MSSPGGVGTAVIQLARTVPLVKILGSASHEKHKELLALGAAHVLYVEEGYHRRILKLYPEGADIVINCYGRSAVDECLDLLKPCGKLINLGSNNSTIYPRTPLWRLLTPHWESKRLSSGELACHNYSITGLNVGYLLQNESEKVHSIMNRIFQMRSLRMIKPCVHAVLPFDMVTQGMRLLCRRENIGKVILAVKEEIDPPTETSSDSELRVTVTEKETINENENEDGKDEDRKKQNKEFKVTDTKGQLNIEVAEEVKASY